MAAAASGQLAATAERHGAAAAALHAFDTKMEILAAARETTILYTVGIRNFSSLVRSSLS
eukprot:6335537-Prymnesium_polylepis.1